MAIPSFDPNQYNWDDPTNPQPIIGGPGGFAAHIANPANIAALAPSLAPQASIKPQPAPDFFNANSNLLQPPAPSPAPAAPDMSWFKPTAQPSTTQPQVAATIPQVAMQGVTPPSASPQVDPSQMFGKASSQTQNDQAELQRINKNGAGLNQINNPALKTLARIGDVAGTIFAPGVATVIPGTTLHNRALQNIQQGRIQNDVTADQARQQALKSGLDAQDTQAQIAQRTAQTAQIPILTRAKQMQAQQMGASKGLKPTFDDNGNQTGWESDPDSPVTQKTQAQNDYFSARADYEGAAKDYKKAQTDAANADPNTPAGKQAIIKVQQAQQRLGISQQNASTAASRLNLSGQEFSFNQDKFYNPQPTAAERGKGDLAQSALERVQEMKGIVSKHPEWFGPVAGRASNVQAAIGSQNPDIQTYLSAAQYLSDHSAGVFGGRGKYITEQLHGLTDPHSNPAALGAALDEAEKAAQGFVKAGTVHSKGGATGAPGGASVQQETKMYQGHTYVKGASGWQLQK